MCEDVIIYIFGYGSLIWRPGFPFLRKFDGYIKGWRRVFWQGSVDHRGTIDLPGRVVTLIKDKGEPVSETWGTVYCIPDEEAEVILKNLDYREKGGYVREEVDVYIRGLDTPAVKKAILYIATEKNTNFIGEEPQEQIANQIYKCIGPSGPNVDYLLNLAESMRKMNVNDEHVFELEKLVLELVKQMPLSHHTHHSLLPFHSNSSFSCQQSSTAISQDPYDSNNEITTATFSTTTITETETTTTTTTTSTTSSSTSITTTTIVDEKTKMQRKYYFSPKACVKGVVYIDDGAVMAVSQRGRSLLAAGVVKVEGAFSPHDLISVQTETGLEISRGVTNYGWDEINKIKGQHSSKISELLGFTRGEAVIHHQNTILV